MANISAYAQKALLDWVLGGASPTRPGVWGLGLSLGAPTSISASEVGAASGYTRQNLVFAPAASPEGSASNASSMVFGPFSTLATISGLQVWDTLAPGGGNMLWDGTLATPRVVGPGDSFTVEAGALTISLA